MIPQCKEINFIKDEEFYCSVCDSNKVDANKKETGKFFSTPSGHLWSADAQKTKEDYACVIFAVCNICLQMKEWSHEEFDRLMKEAGR